MGRIIVIDGNVIDQINRGNAEVAGAIKSMRKAGDTVYIAQQAYREIITENGIPRSAKANEMLLKELSIPVAPNGNAADRLDVTAKNTRDGGSVLSEKDVRVAAEAKSLGAEIWSPDKAYRNNPAGVAKTLGVKVAPECSLGVSGAQADYRVGRELLGLPPVEINLMGGVTNKNPPSGGGGGGNSGGTGGSSGGSAAGGASGPKGGFLGPGSQGKGFAVPMPPNARAQGVDAGVQITLAGVNIALNAINDYIQKKRIDEAKASVEAAIEAARRAKPNQGIVVIFTMRRTTPLPDSAIKPGAEFLFLQWGQGATQDQARQDALKGGSIGPGVLKDQELFSQEAWIAPAENGGVSEIQTPFVILGVARFWMPNKHEATFQNVKFDWIEGFDDNFQTTREIPNSLTPEFLVLRPPPEVNWFNINGKQTVRVPLIQRDTANGNKITVVDLDPYSFGSACAAPIFPLNDDAKLTFESTQATVHGGLLRHVNLSLMRWTRPGNIHLLRFT